jgi:hypothetical protein
MDAMIPLRLSQQGQEPRYNGSPIAQREAPSNARAKAKLWTKFEALHETMDSLRRKKIKGQETFQSTGMPDCNHCNEGQADPSR